MITSGPRKYGLDNREKSEIGNIVREEIHYAMIALANALYYTCDVLREESSKRNEDDITNRNTRLRAMILRNIASSLIDASGNLELVRPLNGKEQVEKL